MDGVTLTNLKQFNDPRGSVYHALKSSDHNYCGFGEVYYSLINKDIIKGWKYHTSMTMNLTVPIGLIQFVIYDGAIFNSYKIGSDNYKLLTIKPCYWVAFKGLAEVNLLTNIANIEHDDQEAKNKKLEEIEYDW